MLSVQLGSALSVQLIPAVGTAGTAWLRLTMGAMVLLVVVRPRLRQVHPGGLSTLLVLGVTTGLLTMAFLAAIDRIPLGTAVAIEFLGPLTVAAVRSHRTRALLWPATALVGVSALTQPWHGHIDPVGIGWAAVSAIGWATYILLTQRVGDRLSGITALSITVPVAAATAALSGIPQAAAGLSPEVLLAAAGLGLLHPVLPFALEMLALRRMTPTAFGTLMALEPGIGVLLGLLVLHQSPTATQLLGICLVVAAGTAAQRDGGRRPPGTETPSGPPPGRPAVDLVG